MDQIIEYLPFLIPLVILEYGFMIYALVHAIKHDKFKMGNKVIWIIIIVVFQIIGPVLYLIIGKEDE